MVTNQAKYNSEHISLRTKFMNNLKRIPQNIRQEYTIAIVEDKPFTWDTAAIEIMNMTELGEKILNKLKESGIL